MRWIPDSTRRFAQRPVYEEREIEREADLVVRSFDRRHGVASVYPLSNDVLGGLAESLTDNVDFDATLKENEDGYTIFSRLGPPRMFINRDLSVDQMVNRFRFTVAHEIGHVVLHQQLFSSDANQMSFLAESESAVICMRSRIDQASADWIEWQAYYFASCLLMPSSAVYDEARRLLEEDDIRATIRSREASKLINNITKTFSVSQAAAEVRLKQLGLLIESVQSSRFAI